jgi:hypothetical protein
VRGLGAGIALLLVAGVALADDVESVQTKDGSVYRGELVERVVNDHVTLKLATGEIKTIAWSDIKPSETRPPPPRPPDGVAITFESDEPRATLQRYVGSGNVAVDYVTPYGTTVGSGDADLALFQDVCTSPCSQHIAPGGRFRVGGEGLVPTDSFTLKADEPSQISASMSSRGKRTAGKYLTITGIAPTLVGAIFLGVAPSESSVAPCAGCVNMQASMFLWGGIVTGVGATMLTIGIVLWATSGSSAIVNGVHVGHVRLAPQGLVF